MIVLVSKLTLPNWRMNSQTFQISQYSDFLHPNLLFDFSIAPWPDKGNKFLFYNFHHLVIRTLFFCYYPSQGALLYKSKLNWLILKIGVNLVELSWQEIPSDKVSGRPGQAPHRWTKKCAHMTLVNMCSV